MGVGLGLGLGLASSSRTALAWPQKHARCSGVYPSRSRPVMPAATPCDSSVRTWLGLGLESGFGFGLGFGFEFGLAHQLRVAVKGG